MSTFLAWPDTDQAAALAWQVYESQKCGECGTHPSQHTAGHTTVDVIACLGCLPVAHRRASMTPAERESGYHKLFLHTTPHNH